MVVLGCYLPRPPQNWSTGTQNVTFLPFLVVTETPGGQRSVWLPYWHEVTEGARKKVKYGQWAPNMDHHLFVDLLAQARADGFLDG